MIFRMKKKHIFLKLYPVLVLPILGLEYKFRSKLLEKINWSNNDIQNMGCN